MKKKYTDREYTEEELSAYEDAIHDMTDMLLEKWIGNKSTKQFIVDVQIEMLNKIK